MRLYSQDELDEHCAEFRPIPFKLQAAMFGTYNQTGMNPRPPSSFHNMTTADTSEELKKRYFDLRRNPERIEPDKRRGHFITQRINAIDMMNRRRWFEARGRVPDDYDILVESGEELNAMFRAELADLPMVPLPRIPDAEGAGGDVDARIPTMSDAVEYEQSLRDRLIRGMKNMASAISKRNQEIANMESEDLQSNQIRTATNEFERDYAIVEKTLKDMVTVVDVDALMVELADIDLQQVQEEQMKDTIRQAQMKNPGADFSKQEGAIRRQGRGLPKLFEEERQETRSGMEREQQEARREGLSGLRGYGF